MKRMFGFLLCVLAGAAIMLLVLVASRDVGWPEYQIAATHFADPEFLPDGERATIDDETFCRPIMRDARIAPREVYDIVHALSDAPTAHVDSGVLWRTWHELGFVGEARIALFGLSHTDYRKIEKVMKSDRRLVEARKRLASLMSPCIPTIKDWEAMSPAERRQLQ